MVTRAGPAGRSQRDRHSRQDVLRLGNQSQRTRPPEHTRCHPVPRFSTGSRRASPSAPAFDLHEQQQGSRSHDWRHFSGVIRAPFAVGKAACMRHRDDLRRSSRRGFIASPDQNSRPPERHFKTSSVLSRSAPPLSTLREVARPSGLAMQRSMAETTR